jgi:hypothetical protein
MLNELRRRGLQVHTLEKIGHNPAYPVTSNWPHLVEEVHAFAKPLVACASRGRSYWSGHSLGGMLSLMLGCALTRIGACGGDGGRTRRGGLASEFVALIEKIVFHRQVLAWRCQ